MGVIANLTGNTADATNYTNIAQDYITQWERLGIAHDADPPHATLSYGANETYSTSIPPRVMPWRYDAYSCPTPGNLYNLFGDRELSLNLVPQSVYDMQSAFYPTVNRKYGVPLDTRNNFVKSTLVSSKPPKHDINPSVHVAC